MKSCANASFLCNFPASHIILSVMSYRKLVRIKVCLIAWRYSSQTNEVFQRDIVTDNVTRSHKVNMVRFRMIWVNGQNTIYSFYSFLSLSDSIVDNPLHVRLIVLILYLFCKKYCNNSIYQWQMWHRLRQKMNTKHSLPSLLCKTFVQIKTDIVW